MKMVAIVSGGMDSVVLAHHAHASLGERIEELVLLSIDYGQRHYKEHRYATLCADRLGVYHRIVDARGIGSVLSNSALTDRTREVPEGHYADETMKQTVVPNRNMILLSIAVGFAVNLGYDGVATAVHAGDHPVYPDCRPEFINHASVTSQLATSGLLPNESPLAGVRIVAPFMHKSKAEIAGIGARLGVPFELTWSCYKGGSVHCGRCSTCVERIEALDLAGVEDRTTYVDREFWKTVVREENYQRSGGKFA